MLAPGKDGKRQSRVGTNVSCCGCGGTERPTPQKFAAVVKLANPAQHFTPFSVYGASTLAGMAELEDALDSGSSGSNPIEVQVLLPAQPVGFYPAPNLFWYGANPTRGTNLGGWEKSRESSNLSIRTDKI